jgi:hypothetical protein
MSSNTVEVEKEGGEIFSVASCFLTSNFGKIYFIQSIKGCVAGSLIASDRLK